MRSEVCLVCGRELSDPESVKRSIGPECLRNLRLELIRMENRLRSCPDWAMRAYRMRIDRIKKLLEASKTDEESTNKGGF